MPGLFINTICNPIAFPIGIINNMIYTIPFCYDETESKLDKEKQKVTDSESLSKFMLDQVSGDYIKTGSKVQILNNDIHNVIQNHAQTESVSQDSTIHANINLDFTIQPELSELKYPETDIPMYNCFTRVNQKGYLKITAMNNFSDIQKEEIVNKVKAHVSDNLKEMGAEEVDIDANVTTMNKIDNLLINNVTNEVNQIITQNSVISTGLNYTDHYGVCDTNGGPKVLEQKNELETISKNIIKSTIKTIMENDNVIKTINNIKINRVDRTSIFFAILLDIFCIFICYYLFKMFLKTEPEP
mgnify:CR=1 FL=1